MKYTFDRLNSLMAYYGLAPLDLYSSFGNLHHHIDKIDTAAGMDTRGGLYHPHWRVTPVPINPVGARVARHERRMMQSVGLLPSTLKNCAFFFMGADANHWIENQEGP